jgi:fructose-bisphosphate aldolase/6-deoxy-5-ketofructose 1-phosphate synthase
MSQFKITPPADVPDHAREIYTANFNAITQNTGRLFLFAFDQKMEHLNEDLYGPGISPDAIIPEHVFTIAQNGRIGALALHLGLLSRYGNQFPELNYIVKLNGKTNLIKDQDPMSEQLWSVNDVLDLQQSSNLHIRGVGYTIYLGSEFESHMLAQAAQIVHDAHQHGLVVILWIYPRGKNVNEKNPNLAAGAAGVGASLGADFVKIKAPESIHDLRLAVAAAGNTRVICSGGTKKESVEFLHELFEQLQAGAHGCATGRNIFQKPEEEAIAFAQAISALVFDEKSVADALAGI